MKEDSQLLFVTNGNDVQGELLLRMAADVARRFPYAGFVVVSDELSAAYVDALSELGAHVHVVADDVRAALEDRFASEAHALGKVAKPALFRHALDLFAGAAKEVAYLDPDVLFQGGMTRVRALSGGRKVVMAAERTATADNPGAAKKLARAVDEGALTDEQCANVGPEINTGFQYGPLEAVAGYLDRFLAFMTSEAMRPFLRNSEGRNNSWHDQDFFRAFLRVESDVDWLAVADFGTVATLNGAAFDDVQILGAAPEVSLPDGSLPDVVHFAGGAWLRSAAARGYFELAPKQGASRRPDVVNILELERAASRLAAAEASAHNWRGAYERLREQHDALLEKWNAQKARSRGMTGPDPDA